MNFRISVIAFLFIYSYIPIVCAEDQKLSAYVPGQILVKFAPTEGGGQKTVIQKTQLLSSLGNVTIRKEYHIVPGLALISLPENISVASAIEACKSFPGVLYAEPDYYLYPQITEPNVVPNDTRFYEQWGLQNTGLEVNYAVGTYDADIDATAAWSIHTDCCDVIVAVIDSGIKYNHPDLAANMWVNTGETPGDSIDNDGNGYVDDICGYDFCTADDGFMDPDPMDYYGHGTHCAGIIGAVGNNNEGIAGVCWRVRLMALKICDDNGDNWIGSAAISALEYAHDMGAKVLSCSWGFWDDPYALQIENAIQALQYSNVLAVFSSGNYSTDIDEYDFYPAGFDFDHIISVMATDENDERSIWSEYSSSNWGETNVDLAAPGSNILSTWINNPYYYFSDGTSMATPFVAGAAAMLIAEHPWMTGGMAKKTMMANVDVLDSLDNSCVTEGRLNVYKAIISKAPMLDVQVYDDVSAQNPPDPCDPCNNTITYSIWYNNTIWDPCDFYFIGDACNVTLTDLLPVGADFVSANPSVQGNYNSAAHTYTWSLGTLDPCDPCGSVELTVRLNTKAAPGGPITNHVVVENDKYIGNGQVASEVAEWSSTVTIYVDDDCPGDNDGGCWTNAYTDLQDAIARHDAGNGGDIWVAQGTYKPGDADTDTFVLTDGMRLYGGFCDGGSVWEGRDPNRYESILTGQLPEDEQAENVVTATSVGGTTVLDGFTITGGENGIACSTAASPQIAWCIIENNGDGTGTNNAGIYCTGTSAPSISHNIIRYNECGVLSMSSSSQTIITNNWIHHNNGKALNIPGGTTLRNNTIAYNVYGGVYQYNYSGTTIAKNCILWGNHEQGEAELESYYCSAAYSCVEGDGGGTNIDDDPCFAIDPNEGDFHLAWNSPCIDMGATDDPCADTTEKDIDGLPRVLDGDGDASLVVDMGADEYVGCATLELDWSADGVINFVEFDMLADAWLSEPGNDRWNPRCDIDSDAEVAMSDFAIFSEYWLETACWWDSWSSSQQAMAMGGGGGESIPSLGGSQELSESPAPEEEVSQEPNYICQYTVGPASAFSEISYDYNSINAAIAATDRYTFTDLQRGCIYVYPGTYTEQINDYYPGGHDLPQHCDLIGMGVDADAVVIEHQRRSESDPNFTDIAGEIYADGLQCLGDNVVQNLTIENVGENQNSVRFCGGGSLIDCAVVSHHNAVTAYGGDITIDGCVIEGMFLPCIQVSSPFEIRDCTLYPKTRSWGGEHPAGIKAFRSGLIEDVSIVADIATSDYVPHYDMPWLAGVITQLYNSNDTVTIRNATMDLKLTTLYKANETATWQVFGVVSGGRNSEATTRYQGTTIVDDCNISVEGVEDTTDPNNSGRGIMVAGICLRGGGTVEVMGDTTITTDRTSGDYADDGYEYALVNQNGTMLVDPNSVAYDPNMVYGIIEDLP